MNDFDDFDELIGPLRTPATPAELAAENDVVDLMVAAHHSSKGNTMFTSRRARVATLVAAGIIGFGGVAAAGPTVLDFASDDPPSFEEVEPQEVVELGDDDQGENTDENTDVEEPVVVEEPVLVEQPVVVEKTLEDMKVAEELPVVELVNDPETDFDETYCIPDGNHGKTVSAVARGEDLENAEGESVSENDDDYPSVTDAAHSSCGKTVTADVETHVEIDDETDDDGDEVEKQEVEADHHADDADHDDDDHDDDLDDDHEKSEASTKEHGRPDKNGNSGHSGRGKSDD